jgi:putative endonuclease
MKPWFLYILECGDGSLYTGITNNLTRRVAQHESGGGAKYTRGRGPFRIAYREECADRAHATKREMEIKAMPRTEKMRLLS